MTNNKGFPGIPPAQVYNPSTRTYQVVYLETNQEVDQIISSSAQSKIIRKWGGNYVSARKGEINPGYGPGFWEDFTDDLKEGIKKVGKVAATTALVVSYATLVAPITATATALAGGAGLIMKESSDQETRERGNAILGVAASAADAHLSGVGEVIVKGASVARTYHNLNNK